MSSLSLLFLPSFFIPLPFLLFPLDFRSYSSLLFPSFPSSFFPLFPFLFSSLLNFLFGYLRSSSPAFFVFFFLSIPAFILSLPPSMHFQTLSLSPLSLLKFVPHFFIGLSFLLFSLSSQSVSQSILLFPLDCHLYSFCLLFFFFFFIPILFHPLFPFLFSYFCFIFPFLLPSMRSSSALPAVIPIPPFSFPVIPFSLFNPSTTCRGVLLLFLNKLTKKKPSLKNLSLVMQLKIV